MVVSQGLVGVLTHIVRHGFLLVVARHVHGVHAGEPAHDVVPGLVDAMVVVPVSRVIENKHSHRHLRMTTFSVIAHTAQSHQSNTPDATPQTPLRHHSDTPKTPLSHP
jgi:hypothetical protein